MSDAPNAALGSTVDYERPALPPAPAELIARFPNLEIEGLLGRGGMGSVYQARQPHLERRVALKVLSEELSRATAFVERFGREAKALARLAHSHIVGVHDSGTADGICYLLLEYVDGGNLRQRLGSGPLPAATVLPLLIQVCLGLDYAHHAGVVHRDIKPENILLDKDGCVKIADFGLAKLAGPNELVLTGSQQVMGTPRYMAPEQVERPTAVDHRADIYALGGMLYELLTGELPLGRFSQPSQRAAVDGRLDRVVLRALEKDPECRYQQALEFKEDLERLLHDLEPQPEFSVAASSLTAVLAPVSSPRRFGAKWIAPAARSIRRHPLRWSVLALVLVGLGLALPLGGQNTMDLALTATGGRSPPKEVPVPEQPQHKLIDAAARGDVERVRQLLANGADPNEKNATGTTALMLVAQMGHPTVAQVLLDHSASIDTRQASDGATALQVAAFNGNEDIVDIFLANGAEVNVHSNLGQTPLFVAAAAGHNTIVRKLLKAGADVNEQTKDGTTALMAAVIERHPSIVKMLLDNHANVKARHNELGRTALHFAARYGFEDIVDLLLAGGADANTLDQTRQGPLHVAAALGHLAIVKKLLKAGADPNSADAEGINTLGFAVSRGHRTMIDFLVSQGVKDFGTLALSQAYELALARKWTEALPLMTRAIELRKQHPESGNVWYFALGGWQYQVADPPKALPVFLGEFYGHCGQKDKSSQSFAAALAAGPPNKTLIRKPRFHITVPVEGWPQRNDGLWVIGRIPIDPPGLQVAEKYFLTWGSLSAQADGSDFPSKLVRARSETRGGGTLSDQHEVSGLFH